MNRIVLALALGVFAAALARPVRAHESRPLYVEVTEMAPLIFSIQWKVPPSITVHNGPEVSMSDGCAAIGVDGPPQSAHASVQRRSYRCESDPAGTELRIDYPLFNPSVSALVRVSRLSGQTHSLLASPKQTAVIIPEVESFGSVARDYLTLGVRHIAGGYDHLLFLVCLIFIARTARRILIAVTGFTIAHSVTLALSALGVVHVPIPPVEAAIALSIVFLAVEIARGDENSVAYGYPIAVSSSFGLLHGFGFAAVLREAGLPQTEISAALLFFNLGVELGQVIFVAAIIVAYQLVRLGLRVIDDPERSADALRRFKKPAAYLVGSLASFWMLERIATFWTS